VAFNSTGSVNASSGNLTADSSGTHSGAFQVASGAGLHFGGGHSFAAGVSLANARPSVPGTSKTSASAAMSRITHPAMAMETRRVTSTDRTDIRHP
jgi:hypothetical protein